MRNKSTLGRATQPTDTLIDNRIERLITIKELAARLQITESGAYKLVYQGKLPHVKVGRLVRFDWGDVLATIRKD